LNVLLLHKKQGALIILISLLLSLIIGCGSSDSSGNNVSAENIQLIKAGKYDEAATWLMDENKTLYNYCEAKVSYNEGDYEMGKTYLEDIEDTYSGPLYQEVLNYKKEMNKKNFEYGFKLIADQQYDEAAQWFFKEDDPNLMKLYSYAQSIKSYSDGDYSMAKLYAEDTKGYTGYKEKEVKEYSEKMLKDLTPETIAKAEAQKEAADKAKAKSEGVRLGMTQQDVLDSSWGKPNDINRTIGGYGTHEQWCYGGNNYLYFEDGILTDIQN